MLLSFDDLIPQGGQSAAPQPTAPPVSGGALSFEDLIPSAQQETPAKKTFGLMDTWPMRMGQSIYNAITLPGDVYQGNAAVPQSANMPGGEDTSSIGRVSDLATVASPQGIARTFAGPPTNAMLKAQAGNLYDKAIKTPVELKPETLNIFQAKVEQDLLNDGISTEAMAPVTDKILNKLGGGPKDSTVTPTNLRAIQKSFGYIKNNNTDPTERMVAGSVLNQFNHFLENLDQVPNALAKGAPEDAAQFSNLVKEANGNYAAYKAAQTFDQRGINAQVQTSASHSGMNLENNLRAQAAAILKKPSLQRGMNPETIQALNDFVGGSRSENTLRALGNVLGGGGGLGMLAAGAVSHAFGLPFEVGPAVGFALKTFANQRANREFSAIGDTIRANSPLAQQGATTRRLGSKLLSAAPRLGLPLAGQGMMALPLLTNNGNAQQ